MNKILRLIILLVCFPALFSCSSNNTDEPVKPHHDRTLYIIGTLENLMNAGYDGIIPVSELRKYGDSGLGTFDKIDGEMTVLHDTVFQCLADGSVRIADDKTTVPFATVTKMDRDTTFTISAELTMKQLNEQMDNILDTTKIYLNVMTGFFSEIEVRSELPQLTKPYHPLKEVLKTDERRYTYNNISGTLIALYTPYTMAKTAGKGWHYHFISDDRTKGGHVLSFTCNGLDVTIDRTEGSVLVETF